MNYFEKTHKARKRFGQNFLQDAHIIDRIVGCINPQPKDVLVEIGPGLGAITSPLIETSVHHLHLIELDRDLAANLSERYKRLSHVSVHQQDALQFDFTTLTENGVFTSEDAPSDKLRIIGNLPYNISTPLMFHLLSMREHITDMHFMLQKEVVKRLAADAGTSDYGRLSVMTQQLCRVDYLFDVAPEAFHPKPKVDSAVVRLTPRSDLLFPVTKTDDFALLVKTAFSYRRKTLKNTLKTLIDGDTILKAGIDPKARPETLSIKAFTDLANLLTEQRKTLHD